MTSNPSGPVPAPSHRWFYFLAAAVVCLFLFVRQDWFTAIGLRWLYLLVFSFLLSVTLVSPIRAFARRRHIMDWPDARKLHGEPTPLLGGVAVYLAFTMSVLVNAILTPAVTGILIAGTGVMIVSLIDDIRSVPASVKLLVLVLATLMIVALGVSVSLFPARAAWGQTLNVLLTILWVVGITSAMNFFDGMDGLAPGLAAITALFCGIIAYQSRQVFLGWMAAALVGSALGFLPYNFRPGKRATIFLGDAGSNFLGFTLAALAVLGEWAEDNVVDLAAPVLIFAVFIYDMVYITIDRVLSGKIRSASDWIEHVGRDHLHHRLEAVLGNRTHTVLFIYALSSALGIGATVLLMASPLSAWLLICQTVSILVTVTILERRGRRGRSRVGSLAPGGGEGPGEGVQDAEDTFVNGAQTHRIEREDP